MKIFPCECCEKPPEIWVSLGTAVRVKAALGRAGGEAVDGIVTDPPHGYSGYYQNFTYSAFYEAYEGGVLVATAYSGYSVSYSCDPVISGLLNPEDYRQVETWDTRTEGYSWAVVSSALYNVSGEITKADMVSYLFNEMDAMSWVGIDSLEWATSLPGSGYVAGAGSGESLRIQWQGQWGFEPLSVDLEPHTCWTRVPHRHPFYSAYFIESNGSDEEERVIPVMYHCDPPRTGTWTESGSGNPNEGPWYELPCLEDEFWDVGVKEGTLSRFNVMSAFFDPVCFPPPSAAPHYDS